MREAVIAAFYTEKNLPKVLRFMNENNINDEIKFWPNEKKVARTFH